jgi:hypothetical protein
MIQAESLAAVETYWGQCTFAATHPTEPPWHLEYVEGKGYLAIANRSFQAGELICCEKPVTWCHGWHPFTEEQISEIEQNVNLLDTVERNAFYEMANVFPEAQAECAGIYMTNSFDMVGADVPSCGMYLVCHCTLLILYLSLPHFHLPLSICLPPSLCLSLSVF